MHENIAMPLERAPSPAVSFHIPELACSDPPRIHPDYPAIDERCAAWVRAFLPSADEAARQRLLEYRVPMWTCMIFPEGTADRVFVASCVSVLIMFIDDLPLVRQAFADGDGLSLLAGHPAAAAFADVLRRLKPEMPVPLYRRYRDEWLRWFESVSHEGDLQSRGQVLTFEPFLELRSINSAMLPCIVYAEHLYDLDLGDLIAADPELRLAIQATNEYVLVSNDIYSYRKEHAAGVTLNAMASLRWAHGLTAQDAVHFLASRLKALDDRRSRLCETLRHRHAGRPDADRFERYLASFGAMCAGQLRWHLEQPRYSGGEGHGWNWTRERHVVLDSD